MVMCRGVWHHIVHLFVYHFAVPSPPLHTSAVAKEEGNGTSQVTVTWQTPSQEFTPVISYLLELVYRDETRLWLPVEAVSPRVSLGWLTSLNDNCRMVS